MKQQPAPSPAYTRGPWYLSKKCPIGSKDKTREEFYVYSLRGNIATIPTDLLLNVNRDAEANAQLIAAAPSHDEALRKMVAAIEGILQDDELEITSDVGDVLLQIAQFGNVALAKAEC